MKKTTKKLVSLFLAVLMLMSCFGASAAAQEIETTLPVVELEGTEMKLGEKYPIDIDDFLGKFIPEKSGLYEVYAFNAGLNAYNSSGWFEGETETGSILKDDVLFYCEKQFLELEKGKTYAFSCYSLEEDYDAYVTVNFVCAHENQEEKAAVEVTCGIGYTAGVYCNDCKRWLSGHTAVFKPHTDKNGDHICDVCKKESLDSYGDIVDRNGKKNASYKLFSDGELVVSGTGEVKWFSVYALDNEDICLNEKVKKIIVEEGITSLGYKAFYDFKFVESVSLPESLEAIEEPGRLIDSSAFKKFEVSPKNKAFSAKDGVLFSKDKKVLLAYPGGKTEKSYTVPQEVERIGERAFRYASDLEALNLPESLRFVGSLAFPEHMEKTEGCVKYVGSVAVGTQETDEGELPSVIRVRKGTKILAEYAFEDADVRGIALPEGLISISNGAFETLGVSSIILPQTVKYIEDGAFSQCYINNLVVPASVEYFGDNGFKNLEAIAFLNSNCKIGALYNGYAFIEDGSFPVELIAGFSGSTAEKSAKENGAMFAALDEGHEHVYFCTAYDYETCTKDGKVVYSCPCGKSAPMEEIIPASHSWDEESVDAVSGKAHYVCVDCGAEKDVQCSCICHKGGIYKFFYKFVSIFWRLFKIKQCCDCGMILHY